jgi:hypothetical protein
MHIERGDYEPRGEGGRWLPKSSGACEISTRETVPASGPAPGPVFARADVLILVVAVS